MKKCHLALLFPLLPFGAKAAVITGQFKNSTPGTQVEILVPHRYIDGKEDHYRGILDAQSRFYIEAKLPEPQLVFVLFNEDRLPIFLSDADTLSLKSDAFQFPLAVSFGNMGAANNQLLQEYLHLNPLDFNEFNNIRFKIGQYWTAVEMPMNDQMENLQPNQFKAYLDTLKASSLALYEQLGGQKSEGITNDFAQWFNAEVTYFWAYHLLVYGHVYAGRYNIQQDFFEFLYEAPIIEASIGSQWYRQFLLAFMARQETKSGGNTENFWSGQYLNAGKLLSEKPLAFFRSEMISNAFSAEKYRDLLPLYANFLQTNNYALYDEKVEDLYQKYARILPGSTAPIFDAIDVNGNDLNLSMLRGKVVYLNFWASWCGACLRKMEFMDEYRAELSAMGIETVNVSIDENESNWRAALTERQFKGRHLWALENQGKSIAALFGVEAIPQYFIIDRNGEFADKAAASQPSDIRLRLIQIAEGNK